MEGTNPGEPRFDELPIRTWPVLRELLTQADRSAAWKEVADWTITVLEDVLGPTWPERAIEQFNELPIPLILGSANTLAFVQTVDLAMRMQLLREVPGFGRARKELRGNGALGRALHFSFQATLCGLAQKVGWPARLEPGDPPADLWLEAKSGVRTTIETRVLGPAQEDRALNAAVDELTDRVRMKATRLGVWTAGSIASLPSEAELAELEAWIEQSAAFVLSGGLLPRYSQGPFDIELIVLDQAQGNALKTPGPSSDLLRRLLMTMTSKAEQMSTAGTEWLCVENYTGIFAFTQWGWSAMPEKLAVLEREVLRTFPESPIAGVIVCSGLSHFNGTVNEEYAETPTGSIGMRYAVEPWRAREVLAIPLGATSGCALWRALFNAERDWVTWALDACELPTLEEILAMPSED
jgi:hypothetical protein